MAERQVPWLDAGAPGDAAVGAAEPFGGGRMWIGEHAADGDILVFDPAETSPLANRLSFYSMTQLRTRVFPRLVVAQQIREVADDVRTARAKKDYGRRAELREAHETGLATARAALADRQREEVVQRHERYLEAHGIAYQGVRKTPLDRRPGKRVRCHVCKAALDDFAGSLCCVCSDVLCSCGACACASRPRRS